MKTITLSVSDISYPNKPTKDDYPKMTFTQKNVDIIEFSVLIAKGYAFTHIFNTPNFKIKKKVNDNFKESNLIALDYDNSPLAFDYIIKNVLIKPSVAYTTYSNAPGKNRFRLIYVLSNSIKTIEEYRKSVLTLNEIIFSKNDFNLMKDAFDISCSSAVQLFLGTNITAQSIGYSETIIPFPLVNDFTQTQVSLEIFNYFTPEIYQTYEKGCCPKTEELNNNTFTKDFTHSFTFGTKCNNEIYTQNPLNNFNRAVITNPSLSYYYVGDQYIYQMNTYMNGSKIKEGKRHKTLLYHAILYKKMNPHINADLLFDKLRWIVDTYYEKSWEIDNKQLIRLSKSVVSKEYNMEKDRRIFIRNPEFNCLSKSNKIKEFHKCKMEWKKNKILSSVDLEKNYIENASELGCCVATVKKYLKNEGIDLVKMKKAEKFEMFKQAYFAPENYGKSLRELAVITGISKSQIGRYVKLLT